MLKRLATSHTDILFVTGALSVFIIACTVLGANINNVLK